MEYVLRFNIYECENHIMNYFNKAISNNVLKNDDMVFLKVMHELYEKLNSKENNVLQQQPSEIVRKATEKTKSKKSAKVTTKTNKVKSNLVDKPKRKYIRKKKASPVAPAVSEASSSEESMENDLEEDQVPLKQRKQDDFYHQQNKSLGEENKEMVKELLNSPINGGMLEDASDDSSNSEYSEVEAEKIDDNEFQNDSDYE